MQASLKAMGEVADEFLDAYEKEAGLRVLNLVSGNWLQPQGPSSAPGAGSMNPRLQSASMSSWHAPWSAPGRSFEAKWWGMPR